MRVASNDAFEKRLEAIKRIAGRWSEKRKNKVNSGTECIKEVFI
jgi:hypothetical protein